MKKLLLAVVLSFAFAFPASASTIPEGAIVKTAYNPDVYIIKYNAGKQYKRLVLNPLVFKSYGHLKWENLLTISQAEMDSFVTSDLVRVDGTSDVYQLFPRGDVGQKYALTSFVGYDMDSVYTINATDFNNYTLAENKFLAIYELSNSVLYVVDKVTSSTLYHWTNPQYKTEEYFGYLTSVNSITHSQMGKGSAYEIKLNNQTVPLWSSTYIFQGNRAIVDSPVCPYAQYITNSCTF